jgi:hypothetical protein
MFHHILNIIWIWNENQYENLNSIIPIRQFMINLKLYILLKDIETWWVLLKPKQCHKSELFNNAFTLYIQAKNPLTTHNWRLTKYEWQLCKGETCAKYVWGCAE